MKTQIEKALLPLKDEEENAKMFKQFNYLITLFVTSKDLEHLRSLMTKFRILNQGAEYFNWGYGSDHFWMHQRFVNSTDRVIFITR